MKYLFNLLKISILLVLLIPFLGCKNQLDFTDVYSIDVNGDWGIPVVNSRYTAEHILNAGGNSNFTQTADGLIHFTYVIDINEPITGADLMELHSQPSFERHCEFTLPASPGVVDVINGKYFSASINFDNPLLKLETAEIKSGILTFQFTHDLSHLDSIVITCPRIISPSHTPLHFTLANSLQATCNLSNYTILFSDENVSNIVELGIAIYGEQNPHIGVENHSIDISGSFSNCAFKYVQAKMAQVTLPVSKSIPADIFTGDFSGSATLYNPSFHITLQNSFGLSVEMEIDTAGFTHDGTMLSEIIETGSEFVCPAAPARHTTAVQNVSYSAPEIYYCDAHNTLNFAGEISLNPAGINGPSLFIDESSTINLHAELDIPFSANLDNVLFSRRLGNVLNKLPGIRDGMNVKDGLKMLMFKGSFENGLPMNVDAQFYFIDTTSAVPTVIDSILVSPRLLYAAQTNAAGQVTQTTKSTFICSLTDQRLDNVLAHSNNTLLQFKIHTGSAIKVFSTQFLQMNMGAEIIYDTENINISSR